jgi:hypothetical protein
MHVQRTDVVVARCLHAEHPLGGDVIYKKFSLAGGLLPVDYAFLFGIVRPDGRVAYGVIHTVTQRISGRCEVRTQ